jgi:Plasmid pRiA4b ORF-3-like protein
MATASSKGTCSFCKGTYSKAGMARHLTGCKDRAFAMITAPGRKLRQPMRLFHLFVEGRDRPEYWMHLEALGSDTLAELDFFLRRVWLECCGHLSEFTIGGSRFVVSPAPIEFESDERERDMNVTLREILTPGLRFDYEYDFGSTTALKWKVVDVRDDAVRREFVQVLARNDLPDTRCDTCGKPATQVCSECSSVGEGWLCDRCAPKHACGEEALLPAANSPRAGVCCYTGES